MKRNDERRRLVFPHFGGNVNRVGKVLLRVREVIGSLLNPGIGRPLNGSSAPGLNYLAGTG